MSKGGPLSILLVEDEELQQLNVRRALDHAGLKHPLYIAGDGAEALELLRSGRLPARCLVLLDVHMPRMDGIEFLREVRADSMLNALVVVMLSTSNEVRDMRAALALNVAGYILKSISFPTFVAQLSVLSRYWSMMEIP